MTRTRIFALSAATAALALSALPAQAQDAAPVDPDLRCAAWALVASAQEQDATKKRGLGFIMSYFVGRYEARTGGKIETQITPQTVPTLVGDIEQANEACGPMAQSYGDRLNQMIAHLQPPAPANPNAGEGR